MIESRNAPFSVGRRIPQIKRSSPRGYFFSRSHRAYEPPYSSHFRPYRQLSFSSSHGTNSTPPLERSTEIRPLETITLDLDLALALAFALLAGIEIDAAHEVRLFRRRPEAAPGDEFEWADRGRQGGKGGGYKVRVIA